MLHLFQLHGDRLAFDTESNALHALDALSYAVLGTYIAANERRPDAASLDRLARDIASSLYPQDLADRVSQGLAVNVPRDLADSAPQDLADSVPQDLIAGIRNDIEECAQEIDALILDGSLFAPGEEVPLEAIYPDQPRIKSMCLHLCHDCNLRCVYCFAGTGDFGTGRRTMLDVETGKKAVDFLLEASGGRHNLDIDFFGGEPLLNWPVVVDLVAYCEQRGEETGKNIRLTITTNAVLLDDEKTAFINQHFKNCVLSIDGRPAVHDRMRPDRGGHGSYERIAAHIRSFVAARGEQEYYLRATFTRHNLDFADDVLHLASLGDQVSVEPVVAPPGSGYEIRPEDVGLVEKEYERLAEQILEAETQDKPFNFFHFMIDLEQGPCAYKRLKGCGVGTEYCAVTPEGDIYPCHQFVGQEQFRLGNVHDHPIVLDATVQEPFTHLLVPDKPECRACWAKNFCSGGCAANAFHASGDVAGQYEIGCRLQKKRLECALWLMAQRRQRDANGA